MLWCSNQKQLHSLFLSLPLIIVIANLGISNIFLGCLHTNFSTVFVIWPFYKFSGNKISTLVLETCCTKDTSVASANELLFWIKGCSLWLRPLHQQKTAVGKEICGPSRGCSALLQACSLGAPFACDCPWNWSQKKHYRAEGRGEKNHKENEWEGRVLMHNAALNEQKKGRRIKQGCCVLTPISLTSPEGSDYCSICNSAQASKQSKLEENNPRFVICYSLYPYCK